MMPSSGRLPTPRPPSWPPNTSLSSSSFFWVIEIDEETLVVETDGRDTVGSGKVT